ncbi:MAG TPA: nucleotidyltransferase [Ignavibacteriales bacterium]|nr:nucleotidyltransferase [Ignavibacteriales bacterium]
MAYRSIEQIKDIVHKFYELLLKDGYPVEKVFLFGSQVKNEVNSESDIDIAIVLRNYSKDRFTTRLELMKYCRQFDEVIEPHPFLSSEFNDADPFSATIVSEGLEIYSRSL